LYFSLALLVALGSQNFLTPVKSAVFLDVVGPDKEPLAKSLCMVVLVPCLIFYSMAVSYVSSPQRLVAIISAAYAIVFLLIVAALVLAQGEPSPWVAWSLYYATETKGVILMPMIWSTIAEVSTPDLAKKSFPILFFVVQIGGILGSLVAVKVSNFGGEINLLLFQSVCLLLLVVFAWAACRYATPEGDEETPLLQSQLPQAPTQGPEKDSKVRVAAVADKDGKLGDPLQTGLDELYKGLEGLWLLLSRPYVFMAFWVSYANLMPRTMLDYQNQVLAVRMFTERSDTIAFFGKVNLLINSGTAILTLLGTRPIIEAFGVGPCLLVLPVGMFFAVLAVCMDYNLVMSTASLVFVCTLAYGLNSPCKEMLYVRTSRDIKYKAKAWSEMYPCLGLTCEEKK